MEALPGNIEMERYVIGAVLMDARVHWPMVEHLTPNDFMLEAHRRIFSRIVELSAKGESVDRVTVANDLIKYKQLESVGGLTYLISLDDGLPQIYHLESYAKKLVDFKRIRHVIGLANNCITRLTLEPDAEAMAQELAKLQDIDAIYTETGDDELLMLSDVIEDEGGVQGLLNTGDVVTGTPWPILDNVLAGGFRRGDFVIIAGRPSDGKTAMSLQLAKYASANGAKGPFFSLETTRKALVLRLLAESSGVSLHGIRRAGAGLLTLSSEERQKIMRGVAELSTLQLAINRNQCVTVQMMRRQCEKFKKKHGSLEYVIVDYAQLIESVGRGGKQEHEVLAEISRGLKMISLELDCVLIALAQFSRRLSDENRPPKLSDLKGSGNFEQDATIVLAPYRPKVEPGQQQRYELYLLKQKDGPTGSFEWEFDGRYMRFDGLRYKGNSE